MWHTISVEETKRRAGANFETGLSEREVIRRRDKYGENKLAEGKREGLLAKFIKQFNDFMIIVLILAAVVSAVMSYVERNK